ncbi:MAG: hypothetical protein K1X79_05265 [Oligoflexia bacterium]|nr:hypothetical protein [Oligoflexia bacterium]
MKFSSLIALTGSCLMPAMVCAQHSIDVQRAAARGDYLEALSTFDALPRRTLDAASIVAAGRSAWALGLPLRALEEFDRALRIDGMGCEDIVRILLSKGIIEFQEGHYQVAALHAERAVMQSLEAPLASSNKGAPEAPSALLAALRSKALLLWADSLAKQKAFAAAEVKYVASIEGAPTEIEPQIHLALARARQQLGRFEEAKLEFERVPLQHELTPAAMRGLAEVAVELGKLEQAEYWLTRGRKDYPDQFLDSWVEYVMVRRAAADNDFKRVQEVLSAASKKYPPSDAWLILSYAAAESMQWEEREAVMASLRRAAP